VAYSEFRFTISHARFIFVDFILAVKYSVVLIKINVLLLKDIYMYCIYIYIHCILYIYRKEIVASLQFLAAGTFK